MSTPIRLAESRCLYTIGELHSLYILKELKVPPPKNLWTKDKQLSKAKKFLKKPPFQDSPLVVVANPNKKSWKVLYGKNKLLSLFYFLDKKRYTIPVSKLVKFRRTLLKVILLRPRCIMDNTKFTIKDIKESYSLLTNGSEKSCVTN